MDASTLLRESLQRHDIHLSLLVADTGLWVHPSVHERVLRDTGQVAMKPHVRRARAGKGEARGEVVEGIRLDDNTYANVELKRALGLRQGEVHGFEACHIWPLTCYKERYHTAVANLVLLPRALASLSDHDEEIQRCLQYRSFELYRWYPDEEPEPVRPEFYPAEWREPMPAPSASPRAKARRRSTGPVYGPEMLLDERDLLIGRVRRWSMKPTSNVHRMIALVVHSEASIARDELVHLIQQSTGSKNAYGALASLLTSNGNAYGRVLRDVDGRVELHPDLADEIRALDWQRT